MGHLTKEEQEAFEAFIEDALSNNITLPEIDLVYLDDMAWVEGGL